MIGRISMDLMIIDITKVKNIIKIGDYLEVFGKNISLDDFARISDTSPYDIITSISDRCEKVYVKDYGIYKLNLQKILEQPKLILFFY